MVLELKAPRGASLAALRPTIPIFLSYVLSFIFVGIYWNNHHHTFQAVHRVNGFILWANLHLLFWLSLTPFVTDWMGQNRFAEGPVALYAIVLLMSAIAYTILINALIRHHGSDSTLALAVGTDVKGKISLVIYVAAIVLAFVSRWAAVGCFILVAVIWLFPDRRIENRIDRPERESAT